MEMMRSQPREIRFTPHINPYADGSVLVEYGQTKVHVTAFVEESVPPWMKNSSKGWVTAEYAMLPGSTHTRGRRDRKGISGRSQEIQRLIGRSLRSIVDLEKLGERMINIDCDVLVADGGTRTASISGAYIALELAVRKLLKEGVINSHPLIEPVAAISVGIDKDRKVLADLNYAEDSTCETDMNIVMTKSGKFVEIQGTAEGDPFSLDELQSLIGCAQAAMVEVFKAQTTALDH